MTDDNIPEKIRKKDGKEGKGGKDAFCSILLTKGKRKGLMCNRKVLEEGEETCKFHQNRTTHKAACNVILTKGERKNKPCNRKAVDDKGLCKTHLSLEEKRPYNPYVEKECDVRQENGRFVSPLGILETSHMDPAFEKEM